MPRSGRSCGGADASVARTTALALRTWGYRNPGPGTAHVSLVMSSTPRATRTVTAQATTDRLVEQVAVVRTTVVAAGGCGA